MKAIVKILCTFIWYYQLTCSDAVLDKLGIKPVFAGALGNFLEQMRTSGICNLEFTPDKEFREKFELTEKSYKFNAHAEIDTFTTQLKQKCQTFKIDYPSEWGLLKSVCKRNAHCNLSSLIGRFGYGILKTRKIPNLRHWAVPAIRPATLQLPNAPWVIQLSRIAIFKKICFVLFTLANFVCFYKYNCYLSKLLLFNMDLADSFFLFFTSELAPTLYRKRAILGILFFNAIINGVLPCLSWKFKSAPIVVSVLTSLKWFLMTA